MMQLLPLPNFHHFFLLFLVLILIFLIAFVVLKFKKKRLKKEKLSLDSKEDLYKISIDLQKAASKEKEVQLLLEKLQKYKYAPVTKPLQKDIKKEILRLYKKFLQK